MAVSIKGLNRADVLAALYNASKPQGMGFIQYEAKQMERTEAEELLKRGDYFDYLKGRVMKLQLKEGAEKFEEYLYDRDNGKGAAQEAIDQLRKMKSPNTPAINATHERGVLEAAGIAKEGLRKETTIETNGNLTEVRLGLADVADKLNSAVDNAVAGQPTRAN